jgi:hypothetical protein
MSWPSTPIAAKLILAEASVVIAVAFAEYLRQIGANVGSGVELVEGHATVLVVVECTKVLGAAAPRSFLPTGRERRWRGARWRRARLGPRTRTGHGSDTERANRGAAEDASIHEDSPLG